ncbi:MAG: rRNA maturation RNase YbeY [Alphaproteobacteria bacterium]
MKSTTSNLMPELEIDIDVKDPLWLKYFSDIENHTHDIITKTLNSQLPNVQHIEISIVLADNNFVQDLNKNYRGKNKPTNVLSFPQTERNELNMPALMLGDIIIASQTIKRESQEQEKTFKDHYTHMLVHGCLHLLHYDHTTDEQAEEMESLETEILSSLGIKNPYAL